MTLSFHFLFPLTPKVGDENNFIIQIQQYWTTVFCYMPSCVSKIKAYRHGHSKITITKLFVGDIELQHIANLASTQELFLICLTSLLAYRLISKTCQQLFKLLNYCLSADLVLIKSGNETLSFVVYQNKIDEEKF